jgi:hypothetical protein
LRRILLLALALALTLGACGGGDSKSDSAAESSPAAQSDQPGGEDSSAAEPPAQATGGGGGASSTDAQRAAGDKPKEKQRPAAPAAPDSGQSSKPAKQKARTPSDYLAALSPSERRKLEHDLYEQGKNFCSAQGPAEIAKSYKFPSTDPETVARLYARAYEQGIPELALPFQQGCLAGFKKFERNPPKS